jgi:Tol biopolymer transport system component
VQRDIWTVLATGGEPVQVTDDAFIDWNPVWSPEGNFLYFISSRKGTMGLWRVAIDERSGKVQGEPELVPTPASNIQHLSFSGDGRQLVFTQSAQFQDIKKFTFDPVAEKISGQPSDILLSSGQVALPDISPDGQFLAYQSADLQPNLFVLQVGKPTANQITDDPTNELGPHWSPDGRRIAYYSNQTGSYQIWLINADGSGARQITEADGPGVVHPIWSPDGMRLAYSRFGERTVIMDLSKPWREQEVIETPNPFPQTSHFVGLDWSSDGRYLIGPAYKSLTNEITVGAGLLIYNIEDRTYQAITDFGSNPIWLNDSRRFLFFNEDKVMLTDIQSKKIREIISLAPRRVGSVDLSKDNQSIYVSMNTTEADVWLLSLE